MIFRISIPQSLVLVACLLSATFVHADWTRFRGPNGTGIAPTDCKPPLHWSDTENLKWKTPIPGPGSSSPIVSGNRVFVTYWSGYATDPDQLGNMEDLKIHLMCVDRRDGKVLWDQSVKATLPEQKFGGMFAQHGYASHTPVTDGERVYAYFGKSGVHVFDMDGSELWSAHVGDGLDRRGWGSASSPVLTSNALIVTGSIENQSMVAYDKKTGKELWTTKAGGFAGTWATPVVVKGGESEEIVLGVPGEMWGLNAVNGKLRWVTDGLKGDAVTGSVVLDKGVVYAFGSRGAGSVAVRTGGRGEVNETHLLWTGRDGANISTPICHNDRLYWLASGIVHCRDAKTGEEIYSERLPRASSGSPPQGGGGRGGRFGSMDYASPVFANGHLYQLTRKGETIVLKLGDSFELVARNAFASDSSDFSGTPAIVGDQILMRSYRNLYCIAE